MNLIEFFGYKKVKDALNQLNLENKDLLTIGAFVFTKSEVEVILLEHRRTNNIFEESDKIVFVDDFMHGELMTVAWTRKGDVWMDGGAKLCTDLSMIRHATAEEIKVGKRL